LFFFHFDSYNRAVSMSVFLDWILELVRILTGSSSHALSQKSLAVKENINISLNVRHHCETRDLKKEKDVVGTIKIFASLHPPTGWLPCDGRVVKIREYPDLFTVIGDVFGGNGKTTFSLPDLRGRVVVGAGKGENLTERDFGHTFGSETVVIDLEHIPLKTSDNLPTHDKSLKRDVSSDNTQENRFVMSSIKGRSTITSEEKPLENVQPSMGMSYIICCVGIHPEDLKDCE